MGPAREDMEKKRLEGLACRQKTL